MIYDHYKIYTLIDITSTNLYTHDIALTYLNTHDKIVNDFIHSRYNIDGFI